MKLLYLLKKELFSSNYILRKSRLSYECRQTCPQIICKQYFVRDLKCNLITSSQAPTEYLKTKFRQSYSILNVLKPSKKYWSLFFIRLVMKAQIEIY